MKKMLAMLGMAAALVLTGCVSTPLPPMDRRVTLAENLGYDLYVTDVRCAKGTPASVSTTKGFTLITRRPVP